MHSLTDRQRKILDWIRRETEANGRPPTRAEMATALGFRSVNAAEDHLRALARKGAIRLIPGSARGIQLKDGPPEDAGLWVVGRVAAGQPVLAREHLTVRHAIDPRTFRPAADYLLTVIGESMRDAGLLDGDLLAVHKSPEAREGQIVVARLGEEVTVKRFSRRQGAIWLLPENPAYQPIIVRPGEDLVIEGVGVGVVRLEV